MKKFIIVLLLILIFAAGVYASALSRHHTPKSPVLNGLVLSTISPQSFFIKYTDIPVGIDKVTDAEKVAGHEHFDSENAILLFSELNLFSYTKISDKEAKLDDLKKDYLELTPDDFSSREILSAVFVSAVRRDGAVLACTKPAEPEIEIQYTLKSAGKGSFYEPHRVVKPTDKIETYFLLDPLAKPENERLNMYDISMVYDVKPCFTNTIAMRTHQRNPNLDFDGFFIDIPDVIPDEGYFNSIENTLVKVQKDLHSRGKLLIIENLNNSTLSFGKFGDIVGIVANGELDENLLRKARVMYPDKTVFITIDGHFSQDNIASMLDTLVFYGIYPEFRRDIDQGDFVYYEDVLTNSKTVIIDALTNIAALNQAGYKGEIELNNSSVNQFGDFPYIFFTAKNCDTVLSLDKEQFKIGNTFTVIDGVSKESILFDENDIAINIPLNKEIKIVRIFEDQFTPIYLPKASFVTHTPVQKVAVRIINAGNTAGDAAVKIKTGGIEIFNETVHFSSLQEKYIYAAIHTNPVEVEIDGIHYTTEMPVNKPSRLPVTIVSIIILLLFLLIVDASKKWRTLQLFSAKQFLIFSILGSFALLLLNRYLIHYSVITITYFIFALLFLLFSLYDTQNVFLSRISSALMIALGLIFNLFEFGTLTPQFFNLIPPLFASEILFFYFPFIFTFMFFCVYDKKLFHKIEAAILLLSVGLVVFMSDQFSPIFILELRIKDLYPLFILLIGAFVLSVLHKKGRFAYSLISVFSILIIFLSLIFSALFFKTIGSSEKLLPVILPLKELILFVVPFYFISLIHHNIEKGRNGALVINRIFLLTFGLLFLFAFFNVWALRVIGSFAIEQYSGIIFIPLLFLSAMLLIEPWRKQENL